MPVPKKLLVFEKKIGRYTTNIQQNVPEHERWRDCSDQGQARGGAMLGLTVGGAWLSSDGYADT